MKIYFWLVLILLSFLSSADVCAGIYFVSPQGTDVSGDGTSENPWYSLQKAFSMGGRNTYVLKDGQYNYSGSAVTKVPSGVPASYTTIKAENDGGAVIAINDGLALSHNNAYIQIEGLKFAGNYQKSVLGNHIKILRCAFSGGPKTGNTVNFGMGTNDYNDTQYILIEDCWFYGPGGRYKIIIYRSSHIVLRRVVVRDDAGWTSDNSDPEAGICIYESSNISCQNCLVIDSSLTTYDNDNVGAYYLTGYYGNPSSSNVEYLGCMAINNKASGWSIDTDDGAIALKLQDIVAYGNQAGLVTSNTSVAMTVNRATIGKSVMNALGNWGKKSLSVSNSIVWSAGKPHAGTISIDYSNIHSPNDFSGSGISHLNPLKNGLLYLLRIENGSILKSSGSGGGQVGANITSKIGKNGSFYDEPGFNIVTSDSLWPWPYEKRIKADMSETDNRGFAAAGMTLTRYIWEYLGNTMPVLK